MVQYMAKFPAFPSAATSRPATALRAWIFFKSAQFTSKSLRLSIIRKASEEENNTAAAAQEQERIPTKNEMAELEKEIKLAMMEREEKEIREIEWPAFGKVLGTTGVVLGVIAGSSVVLLTVNAVLAEISDRAFVGKGVQDFFG